MRTRVADPSGGIRCRVTANPACPPPLLPRLATDHAVLARRRVAANPSTPLAVLRALARDRDATVLGQVGATPPRRSTPSAGSATTGSTRSVAGSPPTRSGRSGCERPVARPGPRRDWANRQGTSPPRAPPPALCTG